MLVSKGAAKSLILERIIKREYIQKLTIIKAIHQFQRDSYTFKCKKKIFKLGGEDAAALLICQCQLLWNKKLEKIGVSFHYWKDTSNVQINISLHGFIKQVDLRSY